MNKFRYLFRSLIRPYLEHATPVWNPGSRKMIETIEKVQRRATKKIHELKGMSYSEKLRALNMPTLTTDGWEATWLRPSSRHQEDMATNLWSTSSEGHEHSNWRTFEKNANSKAQRETEDQLLHGKIRTSKELLEEVIEYENVNSFTARLDKFWQKNGINSNGRRTITENLLFLNEQGPI